MRTNQNDSKEVKFIGEAQISPHDLETEQSVLATMMRYNEKYNEFSDLLNKELFYDFRDKAIFSCIEGVIKAGCITDINSLYDFSKTNNVGGELMRSDFVSIFPKSSLATFEQDLTRVREMCKRRNVWKLLQIASMKINDLMENPDDVINGVISSIGDLQGETADTGIYSFDDSIQELKTIVNGNSVGERNSLTTGFSLFDNYYILRPNTMTVLAAFTSVGKSALAMNIAINVARSGIGVGYYSLEMGKSELAARGVSGDAQIPASQILNRKLYDSEMDLFNRAAEKNKNLPIYIDERSTVSFDKTIRSIRTLKKTKNIGLAIIDYLQIYSQVNDNTEASLAYMARAAKNIAKELGIPVLLLSQLNRSNSHPSIKMLRGSGQIEESADNIILIDRPEAYPDNDINKYEGEFKDESTHNTAKLILAKGRGVGTGSSLIGFEGRFTQFYELEPNENIDSDLAFENRINDEVPF